MSSPWILWLILYYNDLIVWLFFKLFYTDHVGKHCRKKLTSSNKSFIWASLLLLLLTAAPAKDNDAPPLPLPSPSTPVFPWLFLLLSLFVVVVVLLLVLIHLVGPCPSLLPPLPLFSPSSSWLSFSRKGINWNNLRTGTLDGESKSTQILAPYKVNPEFLWTVQQIPYCSCSECDFFVRSLLIDHGIFFTNFWSSNKLGGRAVTNNETNFVLFVMTQLLLLLLLLLLLERMFVSSFCILLMGSNFPLEISHRYVVLKHSLITVWTRPVWFVRIGIQHQKLLILIPCWSGQDSRLVTTLYCLRRIYCCTPYIGGSELIWKMLEGTNTSANFMIIETKSRVGPTIDFSSPLL